MEEQRERARSSREVTNYMGADATVYDEIDPSVTTEFTGYDHLEDTSKVTVLTTETEIAESLMEGQKGTIFVEKTPFYATMGGQEGDKGVITSADGKFAVEDTIHLKGGKIGHVGYVVSGMFKLDDEVTLSVDKENRSATCKNHTATHLLQKALREVLGTHVEQQGSLNNAGHLRFDFSHFSAMTAEELAQVEKAVNEKIAENIPVVTKLMTLDEAKKSGAMALFGEKYGDTVRVVCVDDYSKEFCGGTHVSNTGEIQAFKILSESGVAAGVRRIEALTGQGVFDYYNDLEKKLEEAAKTVKATPANLQEKLEYFHTLVDIGVKEIEIGFPSASETEYEFLRTLIEKNMIPADVTVQVLTQCRDHIIRRTFEAVKGAPRAVIHFYNSTSVAQREQVFHKSKEEIKQIAVDGAKLVKQLSEEYEGNFLFEYSPESFTGTEVDYAVDVCNAVLDIMQPTPDRPMIINLPVTVEMSMPHVYANQIEYCDKHLKYRDSVIISTHPHNDRGTGVACAELAVLAGAQRVECCLFGNGERTGNVDAVTLAMNMYSHGVDPHLDFSNMPAICEVYERVTRMLSLIHI